MLDDAAQSRYTFWVADATTRVDTEALLAANEPLRQADATLGYTISAVASALQTAEDSVFTAATLGGPIVAEPQATAVVESLRGTHGQLQLLRDMIVRLLFWRERAAQVYAVAEQQVEGFFGACRVASYATCGQPVASAVATGRQRWRHIPVFGRSALGVGLIDSLSAYATAVSGSSSGSGSESLHMQIQVRQLASRYEPWAALGYRLGTQLGVHLGGGYAAPAPLGRSSSGQVGVLSGIAASTVRGLRVVMGEQSGGVVLMGLTGDSGEPSFAVVRNAGEVRHYVRELDSKGWSKASSYTQGLTGAGVLGLRRPKKTVTPVRADQVLYQMKKNSKQGEVAVLRHDGPQGRSWSVLVRGTKEWGPLSQNPHDMLTNLQEVAGDTSDQRLAVVAAMEMAGVAPGDPVELVGHSQGGIVVANMASDPELAGRYNLTTVLTAGSPTGGIPNPVDGVRLLALENLSDPVPGLDGQANPPGLNNLTVYFDAVGDPQAPRTPLPGDGGTHDKATYIAALAALEDGAADQSVADFLEHRRAALHLEEGTRSTALHFRTLRIP